MSYLGYKPADQDKSVIDWSGLTKQISDDLLAEKKRRDDTKVFLEQEHSKQLQKINEYEQGLDPQANTWMMEQIQSARNFMMENHRLMKRGIRPVNDKRLVDQNVMNTYTDLNNALKNYNAKIEELSKLPGKANEALIDEMANFAQLRSRKIYNDPNSGAGYLVNVDPSTGEVDQKTLMPVRAINGMQQQSFDVINVTDEVQKAVGKMGSFKEAISSLETLENTRNMPTYKQYVEDTVNSLISSNDKKLSVALDYLDLEYTKDPDDAKNTAGAGTISYDVISGYDDRGLPIMESKQVPIGKILMKNGPDGKLVPDFTPEQEELVKESLRNAIDTRFSFETSKQFVQPRRESDASKTGTAKNLELYNLSNRLAQGDTEAISIIKNQGFKVIDPDTGKIKTTAIGDVLFTEDDIIFYDDLGGILKSVPRTGSTALELAQVIRSGEKSDDVLAAYSLGEKAAKGVIPGVRGEVVETREDQTISQGIPVEEQEAVDFIKRRLNGTKFQDVIEVDWTWGDRKNEITLTNKDTQDSQDFDTSDKEGIAAWLNQYDANLKKVLPKGAKKEKLPGS
jgi:hypothetical protein